MKNIIDEFSKYTGKSYKELQKEFQDAQLKMIKKEMFEIISDALQVDVDDEGNWEITDSSIRHACDDIADAFDMQERFE